MRKKLILKNVGKKFGDFWAVKDVSAVILPNKITAFIGPNGAGKTTLFHLITGNLKPDRGTILYNKKNITGLPPWEIALLGLGKQFQDIRIFKNLTVLENVIVALQNPKIESVIWAWKNLRRLKNHRKAMENKAFFWLEFVGLGQDSNKLARELSFGQQKLLSFARLMAGDFDLLLLDEPTAGVHPKMIDKIEELLFKLVKEMDKTIAVIEHNMSVISNIADWVYFMNEGRIDFTGRTDHVLGAEEVRKTYMGL